MLHNKQLLRIRRDQRGIVVPLIAIVVILVLVAAAVWLLFTVVTNPYGAMNKPPEGETCQSYARGSTTFEVSAFFGAIHGEFHSVAVEKIADLAGPPYTASLLGKKGWAFVAVTISGPSGMEVVDWHTPEVFMDFDLAQQAAGDSKPGTGVTGYACFWTPGVSTWTFSLVFEDEGGAHDVLAVRTVTLEV